MLEALEDRKDLSPITRNRLFFTCEVECCLLENTLIKGVKGAHLDVCVYYQSLEEWIAIHLLLQHS